MLSLCFIFSTLNIPYLVECAGVQIRTFTNVIEFIHDIEEKLPGNDHPESEKEVNDFDDSWISGFSSWHTTSWHTNGIERKSALHKSAYLYFSIKEYPSDVTSPPPDIG
ncbi:hypothetical protein FNH22_17370 [Fulvivirga sp. M361]|uniref:hypothetical protein n=1 Tax=Fulvivirga sp. M361 TaxID=2594266 RepID=UPI00119290C1|nr:hypothetical protein [Fulvivirga sp. M361]TRX55936.1 hypothetical protein FNH22_17370 [Fulvivirga sp. M361]